MKKSVGKTKALKDIVGRAMMARAAQSAAAPSAPAAPAGMGMGMKKGGTMKKYDGGMKKGGMKKASGGSFRKVADGIASKGKTKGKQVTMARGGMKGCK